MKITRQKLFNLVITMSITINVVMLGGLGCIAAIDNHIKQVFSAMNAPVAVYVPDAVDSSGVRTLTKPPAHTSQPAAPSNAKI